ncbi:hypothetical protein ACJJID_04945 [Microbulbifer sp. CnH-101-G]
MADQRAASRAHTKPTGRPSGSRLYDSLAVWLCEIMIRAAGGE